MSPPVYAGKQVSESKKRILKLAMSGCRWRDLKAGLNLPDSVLYRHLRELQEVGWIRKAEDGRYVLTDEGRRVVEELELQDLLKEVVSKVGSREVKAELELMERLDRARREVLLANLLAGLLAAQHVFKDISIGRYAAREDRLQAERLYREVKPYIDALEKYALELEPEFYERYEFVKRMKQIGEADLRFMYSEYGRKRQTGLAVRVRFEGARVLRERARNALRDIYTSLEIAASTLEKERLEGLPPAIKKVITATVSYVEEARKYLQKYFNLDLI